MQALPLVTALFVALVMAPSTVTTLGASRLARTNYRGARTAAPLGVLIVAAALIALIALGFAQRIVTSHVLLRPELGWVATYVLGVAFVGLVDDALGAAGHGDDGSPRGWRGHGAALLDGRFSTGALKAAGAAGLALYVLGLTGMGKLHYILAVGVLALATNLFNLLDLRPGRAGKGLLLLGLALTAGSADLAPLWTLGIFLGPALVAVGYDVRERGMLGDTGANLLGALAGAWLVLTLSTAGDAIALVLLAALTAYGEFRSISAFVEGTPGLRQLDSIGRPRHATEL